MQDIPVGKWPDELVSGDLNGDGFLDLALLTDDGLSLSIEPLTRSMSAVLRAPGYSPSSAL